MLVKIEISVPDYTIVTSPEDGTDCSASLYKIFSIIVFIFHKYLFSRIAAVSFFDAFYLINVPFTYK